MAEIQRAETAVVKLYKQRVLFKTFSCTRMLGNSFKYKGTGNLKKVSLRQMQLWKLNPSLDKNDILCTGGRIQNSQISDMVKFPVVLPRKGHLKQLARWRGLDDKAGKCISSGN